MSLKRYRRFVDSHAPGVGRLYRLMREHLAAHKTRDTIYGFSIAGDSLQAEPDWEVEQTKVFLERLPGHDIVIDIGANIGFYSCLAAIHGKHVLSFEPSPRNLRYLTQNLWANRCKQIEVFPMGLGSQCGLNQIYGFGGIASFVEGWGQSDSRRAELVAVTTLDTILAGRFPNERILVKMDVEGFELEVLKGASQTLRRDPKPTWLVEIMLADGVIPDGRNPAFAETFECFWSAGYECRMLDGSFELVTPSTIAQWVSTKSQIGNHNYLFQSASCDPLCDGESHLQGNMSLTMQP